AGLAVGRRRPAAGLLAAAVLGTAVHFVWLARIGRIDMPLTLTVTVAVGAFYLARRRILFSPLSPRGRGDGGEGVCCGDPDPLTPNPSPPRGEGRKKRLWPILLAGYAALGLGVLLKGPIGFVLSAAVVAAHLLVEGDLRRRCG